MSRVFAQQIELFTNSVLTAYASVPLDRLPFERFTVELAALIGEIPDTWGYEMSERCFD